MNLRAMPVSACALVPVFDLDCGYNNSPRNIGKGKCHAWHSSLSSNSNSIIYFPSALSVWGFFFFLLVPINHFNMRNIEKREKQMYNKFQH